MEMLRDLLALSHVPRWVTHPVARPQTVADHSFRVTVITKAILDGLNVEAKDHSNTIMWALVHDGPEAKTGDVPSPLKVHIKATLGSIERKVCSWYVPPDEGSLPDVIVKLADTIEAWTWLRHYGHGFKDRFDGEQIETKLNRRIWSIVAECKDDIPGLEEAVSAVLREVN